MRGSWREAWIRRRNAWLSDPRFHRFAWRFPPFRPIARARARALFGLVTGFTFSQLVAAAVEVGLFRLLAEGPLAPATLATAGGLDEAAAEDLLAGLAALDVTERLPDGRYTLGIHGAAFVADPGLDAMVRHNRMFYADLADPLRPFRAPGSGEVARYWSYTEQGQGTDVAPYSAFMAATQPQVARSILDSFDFGGVRCLLDVGGGEGAFLEAVHRRHPGLALKLADLPGVVERAERRIGGFATVHPLATPDAPLPDGADCISLVRVVHDHDDAVVMGLFRRAHSALPPGGRLLIAEPMAHAGLLGDVYFRLYMRAMGQGRPRSPAELDSMLRSAGFDRVSHPRVANPYAVQLVLGWKRRSG